MGKIGETTLEIDLSALEHNYNFFKAKLQNETKFLAVVKAFAYGSDMVTVAKKLESLRADYFAVAYVKEGVLLRDAGIKSPILVLHPQPTNFSELIDRCLEPSIYSPRILKSFLQTAKDKNQKNYPIHLKFNTGLNEAQFEMIRSGIGLYGYGNESGIDAQLKPVASLKTIISANTISYEILTAISQRINRVVK